MAEEIINYTEEKKSNWFKNKKKGLLNRYHKYRRLFLWNIHIRLNAIEPDYSKIPSDSIPILINNFNRLELLQRQVDWLLTLPEKVAIVIVDNASTYPPLLAYYKKLNHPNVQVLYLNFNSWRKGVEHIGQQKLKGFEKYIVTDSDLLPFANTPNDLITHLADLLEQYPQYNHVGTSLEINDLPDHNPLKPAIIKHESQFWSPQTQLINGEVYHAPIDTTFAMYRNTSKVIPIEPALRTVRPYTLKHVDWYRNPTAVSEEYAFYLKSCRSFATWTEALKKIRGGGREKNTQSNNTPVHTGIDLSRSR